MLIWIGTQPLVVQKLIVGLPMPLVSSIVTGAVYLTAQQSTGMVVLCIVLGAALVLGLVLGALWLVPPPPYTSSSSYTNTH